MSISSSSRITYSDLINSVVNAIKSSCSNIDSWASGTERLRNNDSYTAYSITDVTVKHTLSDGNFALVSSSTVSSDLTSFLSSRGINTKSGRNVTLKGMLNFYNNIAAFISAHIRSVQSSTTSNATTSKFNFYFSGTPASVPVADESGTVTSANITDSLNSLLASMNSANRVYCARFASNLSCCSSSSSSCSSSSCSSSSCSSSSCSSSSSSSSCSSSCCSSSSCSMFIAYMRL